jgi:hypothetical protein
MSCSNERSIVAGSSVRYPKLPCTRRSLRGHAFGLNRPALAVLIVAGVHSTANAQTVANDISIALTALPAAPAGLSEVAGGSTHGSASPVCSLPGVAFAKRRRRASTRATERSVAVRYALAVQYFMCFARTLGL